MKRYVGNFSSSDQDWIVQKHLEDLKIGKASPGKSFDEDEDVLPDLTLFGSMDITGRVIRNIIHASAIIAVEDVWNQGKV